MGIRFFCECGHRLNVKTFLAGKKGICPECGAKFVIPEQSDPQAEKASVAPAKAQEFEPPGEGSALLDEPAKPSLAAQNSQRPSWSDANLEVQSAAVPALTPAAPVPPAVAEHDPIEMAGNAVWYVRHSDGGQYGPAEASIMQQWLVEGRVAGDSMVWHQGWADWKLASDVFTALATSAGTGISLGELTVEAVPPPPPNLGSSSADGEPVDSASDEPMSVDTSDPSIALARQRDLRRRRSMMMLGGLVFVALALTIAAVVILMR